MSSRWGDGAVCKSESGDRYREGTELHRAGRAEERGSERERIRERQLAAYRQRVRNSRGAFDPEADRQRRYGAYAGATAVGSGVAGGYGIRSFAAGNRRPKGADVEVDIGGTKTKTRLSGRQVGSLQRKGAVVRGRTAAQLLGAGALAGGAGYLMHRGNKPANQRWR